MQLPRFTVIGATTRYAMISAPLRDRFGSVYRLDFYELEALTAIVRRSSALLGVALGEEAAGEIARRARGTPRVANRILRRVRDYAEVRADGVATLEATRAAIDLLEVDALGLDVNDRRLLRAIVEQFEGGPVGLETIAAAISEESDTVFDVYEPFLLKRGAAAAHAAGAAGDGGGLAPPRHRAARRARPARRGSAGHALGRRGRRVVR